MKSLSLSVAAALAATAHAAPAKSLRSRDACADPVTLTGNPFTGRTLHANSFYADEVNAAIKNLSDPSLAGPAGQVAKTGTFLWLDTISKIDILDDQLSSIGCDEIGGFVIYDLPGRDCHALASNGELATGELDRYKSEYIDRMGTSTRE